ncbi:methyl-accepting chemotaxis protein [Alteromonas lipolytica]|uniref:Chemotaxis protein n=1 Tax=Alteromonas lipolytica TaxID=1856405 RepID=A0A1E8FGB1_9ALTE|nr:PAS domain-containing methyl-accepting chemotaxis protein [Alteromonas lipolytica]OFI34776.1 hypothetical protein BFC17_14445 [Alteromonas lipolytica]
MFNQKLKAELAQVKAELAECKKAANSLKNEMVYWELSANGTVSAVNHKTEATLKITASGCTDRPFVEILSGSQQQSPEYQALSNAINRQQPWSGTTFIERGTEKVSLHLAVQPQFDNRGRCSHFDVYGSILEVACSTSASNEDVLEALDRSMAIIEFEPTGIILYANSLFLQTTGYALNEIVGKHHRIFCPERVYNAPDYQQTWNALAAGKHISGRFERVNKQGKAVWLEASYNPVFGDDGKVYKVIKFASDVTHQFEQEERVKEAANLASVMSSETGEQAEKGLQTMTETVASLSSLTEQMGRASAEISELEQQSSELNKMVTAISAIADQTNLLALNAAIEAARAGEQGRGFAVVADEVRELASRTTQSTKEIMAVFSRNDQSTKNAVNTISQGMQTLNEVAQSIEDTKDSMGNIEAGAKKVIAAVDQLSE